MLSGRSVVSRWLVVLMLAGCAGAEHVALQPNAEQIEIVTGSVDRNALQFLGDVQGEAKSSDIGEANQNARNDIKNKAAALGATIVVIDTNTAANAMDWTGRNKVVLAGRAFRSKP